MKASLDAGMEMNTPGQGEAGGAQGQLLKQDGATCCFRGRGAGRSGLGVPSSGHGPAVPRRRGSQSWQGWGEHSVAKRPTSAALIPQGEILGKV